MRWLHKISFLLFDMYMGIPKYEKYESAAMGKQVLPLPQIHTFHSRVVPLCDEHILIAVFSMTSNSSVLLSKIQ